MSARRVALNVKHLERLYRSEYGPRRPSVRPKVRSCNIKRGKCISWFVIANKNDFSYVSKSAQYTAFPIRSANDPSWMKPSAVVGCWLDNLHAVFEFSATPESFDGILDRAIRELETMHYLSQMSPAECSWTKTISGPWTEIY